MNRCQGVAFQAGSILGSRRSNAIIHLPDPLLGLRSRLRGPGSGGWADAFLRTESPALSTGTLPDFHSTACAVPSRLESQQSEDHLALPRVSHDPPIMYVGRHLAALVKHMTYTARPRPPAASQSLSPHIKRRNLRVGFSPAGAHTFCGSRLEEWERRRAAKRRIGTALCTQQTHGHLQHAVPQMPPIQSLM